MIAEALKELEMYRDRTLLEREALAHARKSLASVNVLINCVVFTDEQRRAFDA